MFKRIKKWLSEVFKDHKGYDLEDDIVCDKTGEINQNEKQCKSFEDVLNMFQDGLQEIQKKELQKIRDRTPMHIQNCNTCKGCNFHTDKGGTVYCCPNWVPINYK